MHISYSPRISTTTMFVSSSNPNPKEIPELSSPPLGVEQKVFSSPSPESRLKPPRRSGGEPKNLQHKQVTRVEV